MKIVELLNNITLPLTNEESDLLDKFDQKSQILRSELDSRQQIIANQLVNKDVLRRIKENGKTLYKKKIR